jgi:hypothetical protein
MTLEDGCYSLKLECALRDLGFVDIGWKCVAHAGIFFVQPVGIPDDPEGDLLGFSVSIPYARKDRKERLLQTAKKALDFALGKS